MPTLSITVTGDAGTPAMQITLAVPVLNDAQALAVRLAGQAVEDSTNPYPVPTASASPARTNASQGSSARPS
jgi:hypothetical protein